MLKIEVKQIYIIIIRAVSAEGNEQYFIQYFPGLAFKDVKTKFKHEYITLHLCSTKQNFHWENTLLYFGSKILVHWSSINKREFLE